MISAELEFTSRVITVVLTLATFSSVKFIQKKHGDLSSKILSRTQFTYADDPTRLPKKILTMEIFLDE